MKTKAILLLAAVGVTGPAFADERAPGRFTDVASPTKKGSLLVFPQINVDPAIGGTTFIEIANDQNQSVKVKCYYINEQKSRRDFSFTLTGKATVSWDAGTSPVAVDGPIAPPPFPPQGPYPQFGSKYRGALICWAVNDDVTTQILWNHLHGQATVISIDPRGPRKAFTYNPWAFAGLSHKHDDHGRHDDHDEEGKPLSEPGRLLLNGDDGDYDACPVYNTTTFMPNGGKLGNVKNFNNSVSVISCKQDLRRDFRVNLTSLNFTTYNSRENSFTGASQCIDSVRSLALTPANHELNFGTNFDALTLQTPDGKYKVWGAKSAGCQAKIGREMVRSTETGVLGVTSANIGLGKERPGAPADQLIGNPLTGAGAYVESCDPKDMGHCREGHHTAAGYVKWDPEGAVIAPK